MKTALFLIVFFIAGGSWAAAAENQPRVAPLTRAHAHNDYEHARPLLDALDEGFCSVEADIYLVDGALLVAHDRNKVRPERTLERLYLAPLRERVARHGGRVYPGGPSFVLLIDLKSEAESTYAVLREVLNNYSNILTRFSKDGIQTNAVTAILSGNRPRGTLAAEIAGQGAYAALDGRPEDLKQEGTPSRALVPLVSEDWKRLFSWRGTGSFPETERERLDGLVRQAHAQGRQVRLWGTPDRPEVWRELLQTGVDWINADDLGGLRRFLSTP